MVPAASRRVLLSSLCLAFCYLCCAHGPWRSGRHEWKKLIMVHHWPATVCKEVEDDCGMPPDYWTIHGLWADKAEECNRSWQFDLNEIKDLLQEMRMYWPDVLHASPNRSTFWRHEWYKHGTCVAQLDALNSEKKYFGKGLDLYQALSLNSMLQKLGILPSGNYYQASDIKDALAGVYGVVPKIQCLPPEQDEDVQMFGQIELCFTKDLRLRNCTEPGEPEESVDPEDRSRRPVWPEGAWPEGRSRRAGPGGAAQGAGPAREARSLKVCDDGPVFYPPPP